MHWASMQCSQLISRSLVWYAGTVMTSFNYINTPTRGNWFQTNPPEHESDDRAGSIVSSVCVTNGKDMALHKRVWSTFVTALRFRKLKFQTELGYWFLWESCELQFPNLSDNFGTVSSDTHLKVDITIFIPLKWS